MPRRRRHATIDGESPASRRRRIVRINQQRSEQRRRVVVLPSQVSTPDSPETRRRRQRRYSYRRCHGLPSETPPTPVVPPIEDDSSCRTYLPMTATLTELTPVVYTADDDDCVRTTTIPSPVCATNTGARPTIRRNLMNTRERNNEDLNDCLKKLINGEEPRFRKLEDHPDGTNIRVDFFKSITNYGMIYCVVCKEKRLVKYRAREDGTCKRCVNNLNAFGEYLYGASNNMDPFCNGYPDLPKLSTIEEMLISKVFVVMQMYRISGTGAVGYKGHCLNVQHDIEQVSAWCRVLPWLPNELPIYIIRMVRTDNVSLKLFKVNLDKVRRWLMFLKLNHPEYRNVQIDYDRFSVLSSLTDDDGDVNITTGLTQISEEEETTDVTDNNDTSNSTTSDDDNNVVIEPEIDNGPEQGGATSFAVDDSDEVIQETHIFLPADRLNTESDQQLITTILRDEYGTNENPFAVNVDNTNTLNDYNTPSLQSMAFPTLFPYGVGDITMRTRRYDVTFTNAMKHYLNYAVYDPRLNTHIFPFAEHSRWVHWAQNTEERHRFNSQRTVFLRKNEGIANLSEQELRRIINEGGDEFNALIRKMHVYNANIIGSSSYFYKKRKELEALMETAGMPTGWFTLSAADNHWSDLHNLLYSTRCLHDDVGYDTMTEKQKTRFRISMVLRYPHIVDEYFQTRVKLFIKSFLVDKQSLDCKYYWYRIEYQQRGTAHVHGCFRLNSDPGITKLCEKVRDGRIAARKLQLAGLRVRCREVYDGRTSDDVFVERDKLDLNQVEYRTTYTRDEIEALQRTVEESIGIEEKVCAYNDFLFSTYNEDPPSDAFKEERDVNTKFAHTDTNVHPSTLCHGSCNSLSAYQLNTHYCKLVNTVQRHFCSPYCWVNEEKDCRFSYPHWPKDKSHIAITEHIVSRKQKRNNEEVDVSVLRYTIDLKSRRNDYWVNSHNKTALQSWMANIDMRLVCDIGKVVDYLTKYITKTEKTLTRAAEGVITCIMTRTFAEGNDVITTLRRIMGKLLGCRMMSQQESCHLINSFALVSSSHNFILVNVIPTANVIGDMTDEPAEETALEHVPDDIATVYSLLEMYGMRNNADKYYHTTASTLQLREFNVSEMIFHTFC